MIPHHDSSHPMITHIPRLCWGLIGFGLVAAVMRHADAQSPVSPPSNPPLLPPMDGQMIYWSGIALVGAIGLHLGLGWMQKRLRRKLAQGQTILGLPATQALIRVLLSPLGLRCIQAAIWLTWVVCLTDLSPVFRQWRNGLGQFLDRSFSTPILSFGKTGFSILDIAKLLLLVILLWLAVRAITELIKTRFLQATGMKLGNQAAIAQLIEIVLMGLGLLIILPAWGIDLQAITILASVLGVGIGFGLQHIANNLISGLIILFERPIQVGDFINLGDLTGTVERIGARSTEIRTLDWVTIIVPNSQFVQSQVVNWSHGHPVSRLHIPFGVAQGSTIKRVQIAVLEAAKTHSEVLHYPQPQLLFNGFGDASLNFDLVVWIREPRHQVQIKSDLYYLLEANLRRYRIELPLQQQEIKLQSSHLDILMAALTSVEGESLSSPPSAPTSPVDPLPADTDDWLADLKDCVFGWQHETLTIPEMQALVAQMRGDGGLEIKDRRYGLSVYAKCFVGSDAVAWLVQAQKATREAAVRIGQQLMEQGMLHHVTDEHPFRDDYLFYRFYLDEREDS